jgi:hypothetical protein
MSTGERTADDRTASIEALTATLGAGLDVDEAAAKLAARYVRDWTDFALGMHAEGVNADPATPHVFRTGPARVLREVKAKRGLLAAILAEPHTVIYGDEFYSCSQAVDPDPAPGEGGPGSGCADDGRAGQPCDCGRDARVERLLRILAGVYEAPTTTGQRR